LGHRYQPPIVAANKKRLLALDPELGSVHVCGACNHIHVNLAGTHLRMNLEAFQAVVILIERAAANFELWAEGARRPE
jgi:hypothetical protein